MPYKDLQKRRDYNRRWMKKKRQSNPAKLNDNVSWWKGSEESKKVQGTIVDVELRGNKCRYHIRTPDERELVLETTKVLSLLLQSNQAIAGDEVEIEYVGMKRSKRNGRMYKDYKLLNLKRRNPLPLFGAVRTTTADDVKVEEARVDG